MDLITHGWFQPYLNIALPDKSKHMLEQYENDFVFQNCFIHNMLTALDRYYIDGLPETCSQRVALESFLWYGNLLEFTKDGSVYALPIVNASEGYTVYGEWVTARWVGLNGESQKVQLAIPGDTPFLRDIITSKTQTIDAESGVRIRANKAAFPFIYWVWLYSKWEADTLRSLDTARFHLKIPYLITAQESVVPSVEKWLEQIGDNMKAVVSSGVFPTDKVQVTPLNVSPQIVNSLTALYDWYDASFMGKCGIAHNSGIDKKGENLITPEIGIDEESDNTNLNIEMDEIQEGLDLCNKIFGTSQQVKSKHLSKGGMTDASDYEDDDVQSDDSKESESDQG